MSKIPIKYNKKVLFYTKYTHPTLICRGTDTRTHGRTDARTDGQTENIYSIFRDKLLLRGEHVYQKMHGMTEMQSYIKLFGSGINVFGGPGEAAHKTFMKSAGQKLKEE
jgi:hypothetical protein